MTPPQKQPAVTREEVENLFQRCAQGEGRLAPLKWIALKALTERDEAIREVERLKEQHEKWAKQTEHVCDVSLKNMQKSLDEAVDLLKLSRKGVTKLEAGRINKRIDKFLEILATQEDSGGEKKD